MEIHSKIGNRRVKVLQEQTLRSRKIAITLLAVGLAVVIGAAVLFSPILSVKNLYINGAVHESRYQIESTGSVFVGSTPMIDASPQSISRAVDTLPWVMTCIVHRSWPWTIKINIVERIPVAYIHSPSSPFILIDRTGRVLGPVTSANGLPEITGFNKIPRPGFTLGKIAQGGLEVASELGTQLDVYVTSINVISARDVSLTVNGSTTVILGGLSQLKSKLVSLYTVLAKEKLSGASQIDLSDPSLPTVTP